MKRIIPAAIATFMAMLTLLPAQVYGQRDAADPVLKIFDKYEEREGIESITISPALLGLMRSGSASDKKTQELSSKISGLRILSMSNTANSRVRANRDALSAELQAVVKTGFEEIMKVRTSEERVELYVRNRPDCKDCAGALLFIASSDKSFTVMHLAGTIDKTLIDAVMKGEIGLSNR